MFLLQLGDLTLGQILEFIFGPFGTLFICLVIIYTGYKGYWVFGWYAKELRDRNIKLETKVDDISGTAKSIANVAEQTAKKAEEGR